MASFKYTSLAAGGAGTIDASDRSSALRQLMSKGITPKSIEQVGGDAQGLSTKKQPAPSKNGKAGSGAADAEKSSALALDKPSPTTAAGRAKASEGGMVNNAGRPITTRRSSMSLGDTANFIRELATALQAGLPIVPAMRTLGKSGRSPGQRAMLAFMIEQLETGRTLSQACASWGKPFGELIVSLIRAGELSGRLAETLQQAGDLLERELKLRRTVMSATLYPIILLLMVSAAIVVVSTFIVPKILEPLKGQNIPMPLPTQIVQGFAWFVGAYWWAIAIAIVLAAFAWVRARAMPASRLAIDSALVRMPLVGPVVRDAAVARFTRTLGTLVQSGLPVLSALRLTAATMTNHALRVAVFGVCDEVAGGKTISEPLEKTGIFPPLLVQIVSLGERSGKLPELLGQAANALDGRTETRVKVLSAVLPPILVVLVACVVGVVVAAILLPLLSMQDAASRL